MRGYIIYIALLLGSLVNAQNPWLYENSYYGFQILEAYDGGTLILANADG